MKNNWTFTSDAYGYMIYLNGKPMGGAGTLDRNKKHWRYMRADSKMNYEIARRECDELNEKNADKRL